MKFLKTFLAGLLAFVVGSLLMGLIGMAILFGMIGSITAKEQVHIGPHAILKIDFAEAITDAPSQAPFGDIDFATLEAKHRITLLHALRAIEAAKDDPRIQGIYLRPNGGGAVTMAIIEELREALEDFRSSGKFILAYNESYGQMGYYLASVADKVYMEPNGAINWVGLSTTLTFYRGLFDKLDVHPEIFRPTACRYKSAVEPYTLSKMSDENREQMNAVLNSYWSVLAGTVAEARGIELDELNRLTDRLAISLPEEGVEHGLLDGLIYEDQMDALFAEHGAVTKEDGQFEFVTLGQYVAQRPANLKNLTAPQVAVVYAEGPIVDGEGHGEEIFGNSFAAQLAAVRRDEAVKAVVVRINSPGGSALASDVIWREMELLKAEKPVVVSMGQYAASGGYYIACGADVIVADRTTLTGSIGVFGLYLRLEDGLRNKLGVTFDTAKTHTSADMGHMRPLTGNERAKVMRSVDRVYDTFTTLVAEGRNLPHERVLEIAGGRIWSGADALKNGLVDATGGLKTAIAVAAEKAELGDRYRVVEHVEAPTGLAAFVSGLSTQIKADIAAEELGPLATQWRKLREVAQQQGVVMYCPYTLEIE